MRRDTQIGIILGIVILVIIGVFLSTRTDINVPQVSNLAMSGGTQQHEIEEININDLIEKAETDLAKEAVSIESLTNEHQVKDEIVSSAPLWEQSIETDLKPNETFVDTPKDNTSLKGKWEGIPENIENPQITEKSQIAEELQFEEETRIVNKIPYEEEKETLHVDRQQVLSVEISTKAMHKVKPNDSLFKISKKYFGDESKWYDIFEANKDSMSDPHSLYVGQELLIPNLAVKNAEAQAYRPPVDRKPEHNVAANAITHTVQSGDSLYRIAGKYYDDPAMWEKIYVANKESIEDQGLRIKGQIPIIPQ